MTQELLMQEQQFMSSRCQSWTSSLSFIRTVPQRTGRLRQSTFFS